MVGGSDLRERAHAGGAHGDARDVGGHGASCAERCDGEGKHDVLKEATGVDWQGRLRCEISALWGGVERNDGGAEPSDATGEACARIRSFAIRTGVVTRQSIHHADKEQAFCYSQSPLH